jgi:hypothetical protein
LFDDIVTLFVGQREGLRADGIAEPDGLAVLKTVGDVHVMGDKRVYFKN